MKFSITTARFLLPVWRNSHVVPMALIALCIFFVTFQGAYATPRKASSTNNGRVFASSKDVPLLQFPEGLTSWQGKIYVGTFNVVTPAKSRVLVFDLKGKLLCTLGGRAGQELLSQGPLLGLTINHSTGDLFVAANGIGKILRVQNPGCEKPRVSIYAVYPKKGGGPEDMAFNKHKHAVRGARMFGEKTCKCARIMAPGSRRFHIPVIRRFGQWFNEQWMFQ